MSSAPPPSAPAANKQADHDTVRWPSWEAPAQPGVQACLAKKKGWVLRSFGTRCVGRLRNRLRIPTPTHSQLSETPDPKFVTLYSKNNGDRDFAQSARFSFGPAFVTPRPPTAHMKAVLWGETLPTRDTSACRLGHFVWGDDRHHAPFYKISHFVTSERLGPTGLAGAGSSTGALPKTPLGPGFGRLLRPKLPETGALGVCDSNPSFFLA